jgi:hypothetical protein
VLLKKSSSDGYVLLKADDDSLSGENDLSLVFQTSYTIVQRDDARNAKIFADNFPRAAKLEPFGRRLINLEEDIRKARLNFETQTLRTYKVDKSTPNEMANIRDQLRQQLAGSLQDQFFSLSLKRKLLNIIDEIVNFSQRGDSEAATVKTESLAPVKHKQLPAPDSDSSLSSSIEAKCARATYRSIPRDKERFRQSLEFCGQMLPDQIADRIISVLPSQAEMGVKQAALSSDQLLLGSQYPLLPLASGSQPSLLPGFGIPPDSNPLMQPPIGPNGPVGHFFGPQFLHPAFSMGANAPAVPLYPHPQQQQPQQQQLPPQRLLANSPANSPAYQGSSGPIKLDGWDDASN